MKMTEAWYEIVEASERLTQGDLILNCPLIAWKPDPLQLPENSEEANVLQGATTAIQADVVVMTQACDLEHEKVANIILCPHFSLVDYRQAWEAEMYNHHQNPTEKAWKRHCNDICDGFVWNLTMLNASNSDELSIEHRIVDFHYVYSAPRSFLESLLNQRKQPRLRLLPPYREHLSQAFARFFMRVGLPVPINLASF
jgi:hypothetical protein